MTDDILNDDGLEPDGKRQRGGRKKEKPPKAPKKAKAPKAEGEGFQLRQWLVDSYNGVFKIVIQPQLPSLRVLGFMLIAFLLGMYWAYQPAGVQFYDGAPHQMRDEHQDQYVIGVAASALARIYDTEGITSLLERVDSPAERVQRLRERGGQTAAALEQIEAIAQTVQGRNAPSSGSFFASIFQIIVAIVAFVIIVNVFALVWGLLIGGYVDRARLTLKKRIMGETEDDKRARETMEGERRRREIAKQMQADSATANAGSALGMPVMSKPSIYFKGRAYDDSFAIEDANDMFLGETGATTAKTIGDGQELAAVEVWLFDKDDFVKTYTRIFVTEHGFNDPVMMSDLETRVDNPATDIMVFRVGAEHTMESASLILKTKVVDATYGSDPSLPVNSYVENMTLQVQAWQRQGQAAPAAVPTPGGLPDLSSYEIGPPPDLPPSYAPPPTPSTFSGQRDLSDYEIDPLPPGMPPAGPPSAPPMPPAPTRPTAPPPSTLPRFNEDDDDPFGGTADFTPTGR
ncbi:MAG: hypothetical protein GFH27_549367n64 [Chloroflexi bacterium AL-W]|nr:hypothetical protein [Chloroflexi bacterium AL-W]